MNYAVGALVKARGREWVVLPESDPAAHLLVLRPLGGTDDERAGVDTRLEPVTAASFPLPSPDRPGNHRSASLLRDAVRLGFRSAAGPFRSLAGIAISPRPYQLVPLLMALRQEPVRLLIADDVGIGKTIEAALIARELLDRGEIRRVTVLCPPHLAEQWQRELDEKFHLSAALVLSGTAARLERHLALNESLFDRHPVTVVSTDYVKQERRRHTFLNHCPELVIVDEAHTCADTGGGRSAHQQRHELLKALAADPTRHLILVTATPHSGKEAAFRSLLGLLDPAFLDLPEDLSGDTNRRHREHLARHLVQRRRADLKAYLDTETPFPDREEAEHTYPLDPRYRAFLDRVLDWCRELITDTRFDARHQRVRWWSALALLRAVSSSPAAAIATFKNRSAAIAGTTPADADDIGRRSVLDLDDEPTDGLDVVPGADPFEDAPDDAVPDTRRSERRRLAALAADMEELAATDHDTKKKRAVALIRDLVHQGHSPIVFCRFIPTVDYLVLALRKGLPNNTTIEGVTGLLPADERERRVDALGQAERRVLVCTDCLSEGINLQHRFDAVVHYDLSWNPTRHEQRNGRVDRFGQERTTVRTLTLYGQDNPVDGIVLDVLLRKHNQIRKQLGVAVPVPTDTQAVVEAVMQGLLLRDRQHDKPHAAQHQLALDLGEIADLHAVRELDAAWELAADREKRSRTLFRQSDLERAINEQVKAELDAVRASLGGPLDVERFVLTALRATAAAVSPNGPPWRVNLNDAPRALRDALGDGPLALAFDGHVASPVRLVTRTHPIAEAVAAYVAETALDPDLTSPASRAAVIRTHAVSVRTTLLLLRLRFHIATRDPRGQLRHLLAEDQRLLAFTGSPDAPTWLPDAAAEALLLAEPDANITPDIASTQLARVLDRFDALWPHLEADGERRAAALFDAHRRVRQASGLRVQSLAAEVHGRPDVLGVYVYQPAPPGAQP